MAGIWDRGIGKGNAEAVPDFSNLCDRSDDTDPAGRYSGAVGCLLKEVIREMSNSATGIRNILIWLIVLGILSALLIHFVEVFDKHQIADLSFYFIYLLMGVILLQCFSGVLETARETVENIVLLSG